MRRILLRCDAGALPFIGTGHLRRCLLLAAVLRQRGCAVAFCGWYDETARRRLEAAGFAYLAADDRQAELDLLERAVDRWRPEVLVFDRLDTEAALVGAVRELVPVLVTLDDLGLGARLADIVVNAIVGERRGPYDDYAFVIVPPPAEQGRLPAPAEVPSAGRRPRVVLTFGGYDHRSIGPVVAEAMAESADAEFLWLVGGGDGGTVTAPPGVTVLIDSPDFGEILASADVAVLAGGLTLFEALAHGIPAIAIPQYDHQEQTIRRLARRGAVMPVSFGSRDDLGERVSHALSDLLGDPAARSGLRRQALEVVDGRGRERVADLCVVVEQLAWDSEFFGMPIARIFPQRLNERLLAFVLEELDRMGTSCAYYLADSNDPESIRLAEVAGFHFVDVRITFERGVDGVADGDPGLRRATIADIPELEAIAQDAYTHSRYFFDRHFDRATCERFYSDWIRKCVTNEFPAQVFVADDEGGIAGYIALAHSNASISWIVLVGVADDARGRGVGERLVRRALRCAADEGRSRVQVVTQGRNYGAQRLYQRCGFVTVRTELWYHWWSQR